MLKLFTSQQKMTATFDKTFCFAPYFLLLNIRPLYIIAFDVCSNTPLRITKTKMLVADDTSLIKPLEIRFFCIRYIRIGTDRDKQGLGSPLTKEFVNVDDSGD